jgi:methyltransferase-like protein/predicted O-methyltransferase YrrM
MNDSGTEDIPAHCRRAIRESHPSHMAMVATLLGLEPPSVESARILEVGCGDGGNLIPIAVALPSATVVGIESDVDRLESARSLAHALSLANVQWHAFRPDALDHLSLGTFDYVLISHNIAQWPNYLLDPLLRFSRAHLADQGIMHVGYSTLPGSAMSATVRALVRFTAQDTNVGGWERIRDTLQCVVNEITDSRSDYARLFAEEVEQFLEDDIQELSERDSFTFQPLYYRDLEARANQQGLRQIADARLGSWRCVQPSDLRHVLQATSNDPLAQEQILDFLRSRRYRRSFLVHSDRQSYLPSWAGLSKLKACALYLPTTASRDMSAVSEEFNSVTHSDRRYLSFPYLKALVTAIGEAWPRSVRVTDAVERACVWLAPQPIKVPLPGSEAWASLVVQSAAAGLIDLHVWEPRLAVSAGPRPHASSLARHTAATSRWVVNLRHQPVSLAHDEQLLLPYLDGTHDRGQLNEKLIRHSSEQTFVQGQTGPLALEPALERIARRSLLLS